ncbi:MAG: hypothetical protein JW730_19955 [Anaerolineales bacterium]|nr:hypothetical protein [Anaerolineales bacterium]
MSIGIEFISALIGLILTLLIFSYLIGDSPLFRIAVYLFIGVSSGYAAAVVWHYVLIPKLFQPLAALDPFALIPLVFGISLFTKFSPRISWIGNFAMAVLVGVGAAAAIGGALLGTLIPQFQAATGAFDLSSAAGAVNPAFALLEGTVMFFGTVLTLAAFHFSAGRAADGTPKRPRLVEGLAWVGRIFIAITLGVLFAGVYMAALTAMIERLSSIINFISQLTGL